METYIIAIQELTMNKTFLDYFADLPDPRVERTKLHKLDDILAITICTGALMSTLAKMIV